ncbi:zinc ribbon domain-containing protein [Archaeoglobus sulfaticallidus]|uniref:zinc ribbon domain-containing protein n=1 Tax=Archaeoglobus sulfaticallidus TaxID=1316941 RepID=UPI00146156C1|nr:zinc ribbon domain-containing protein [Archaeoglobus sulfaticallidus]
MKITAENFGIKVKLVNEAYTSSRCLWCGSKNVKKHKRLFKCLNCGVKAHRDIVGVLNIARLHGEGFNGVLAHPLFLRVDDAPESKSSMWVRMEVRPSEARIIPLVG